MTVTGQADAPALLSDLRDGILRLTFNRPRARNALNWELRRSLIAQLEAASRDHAVRVVVLAGDEKAFCAGGDVKEMGNGSRDTSDKLVIAKAINQLIAEAHAHRIHAVLVEGDESHAPPPDHCSGAAGGGR